jgi:hypothetical protein
MTLPGELKMRPTRASIGLLLTLAIAVLPMGARAQVPADPTGTRPPVLAPAPGAAPAETTRPHVAPAAPAEPKEKETAARPAAASEPRKVPQVTSFPELVEGEGDSQTLLRD